MAANYTSWPGDLQHSIGLEIAGKFIYVIVQTVVNALQVLIRVNVFVLNKTFFG